jgi:hypothetical protein
MAFTPENPDQPFQLYMTFDNENNAVSYVYNSPEEGPFSRVGGQWESGTQENMYINERTDILFVSPEVTEPYDLAMSSGQKMSFSDVQSNYSVKPDFGVDFDTA